MILHVTGIFLLNKTASIRFKNIFLVFLASFMTKKLDVFFIKPGYMVHGHVDTIRAR